MEEMENLIHLLKVHLNFLRTAKRHNDFGDFVAEAKELKETVIDWLDQDNG